MSDYIMAQQNGRRISGKDSIFGISSLASKAIERCGAEHVINSTIGALLDDDGQLIVLSSVMEALRRLSPAEFAEYAPIAGTPDFLKAIPKIVFGKNIPHGFIEAVASPGGTGAIHNAVSNYSKPGGQILAADWRWSPYDSICQEIGRSLITYTLFNEAGGFNAVSFEEKLTDILACQDQTVVILNTPAHNPTGYTFTLSDWDQVLRIVKKAAENPAKQIAILTDIAYLDFSGDPEKNRAFMPKLSELPENILPLFAFSASKGYTMYGMRCGALVCLAPTQEIAEEFKRVCSYSSRSAWSNSSRPAMTVISQIASDPKLTEAFERERASYRLILNRRGTAFMEGAKKANLATCPFDSGFFIMVPCDNPTRACEILQKENIFAVPLGKGLRVSVASISEEKCSSLPAQMKKAIEEASGK